ncbi:hypothetical protein Tco_0821611 [Tanacetum coccineum]|uniref:Uncharacterized protein n=1 Tax=Tanacetum coccineum TaxID=301880 RepID=A0ABQ5AFQ9_9ASTR
MHCCSFEMQNKPVKPSGPSQSNAHGTFGSFVSVARDFPPLIASVAPVSSSPMLVLDDSCVVERDLSCHVMGRVKDNNSYSKHRIITKEGFVHVKLRLIMVMYALNAYNDFVSDETCCLVDMIVSHFMLSLKKRFAKMGEELFTWYPSFLETMESVLYSVDESKHGARILNDGAQNSDVESDDECNVDGVSETVFSDNVDECNVDGHGKETEKQQQQGSRWNNVAIIIGAFMTFGLMDERLGSYVIASGARCFDSVYYVIVLWCHVGRGDTRLLGRNPKPQN